MITTKKNLYWICQLCGWFFYTAINLFFFKLSYKTNAIDIIAFLLWFPLGISISHFYKQSIIKFNILKNKLFYQIPFISGASFIMALVFFMFNVLFMNAFGNTTYELNFLASISKILSLMLIFIIWSFIYFGFHYFDNYKKTEIQNLKLNANKNEIELNTLKSQLNPHFMFNSLNSIRALINEDPDKAKHAVTQLSNILRNTLMMHKHKFILFEEEMKLVNDYLALEKIRYEERLTYHIDIEPRTLLLSIPPMMIQTLVENAIKHGINSKVDGGTVFVKATLQEKKFHIEIKNTGQLVQTEKNEVKIGTENTNNRLHILYGDKATFSLKNIDDKYVMSELNITIS